MSDTPNNPGDKQPDLNDRPAPWERKPAPEGGEGGLSQNLAGANPSEYTAEREGEAGYLAGDDQSLQSKIAGGGLDSGSEAAAQETKLCPGCGRVTTFVQGTCTNCNYKLGSGAAGPATPAYSMPATGGGVKPVVIVVVVVVLLAIIGWFAYQLTAKPGGSDSKTPQLAGAPDTHPGVLDAVAIDEIFHADLEAALETGNQAWQDAGVDCHVYRYSVFEQTEPAISQRIIITGFTGGEDVRTAIVDPGKATFDTAFKPFLDQLGMNSGVDASITLRFTDGNEAPAGTDKYIRYGYYYGKEHWADIGPIVDALEGLRQQDGEYPHSLSEKIISPKIRTYGNLQYMPNGFGFIPEYKTNSSGNIIMGTGGGLDALLPEECTGYYLLVFAPQPDMGIDFFDNKALMHYREYISPFPYSPKSPVTNVPLNPDGEPDGIACIVYSGELLRVN